MARLHKWLSRGLTNTPSSRAENLSPAVLLNIQSNRASHKYSRVELLLRVLWGVGYWLLRLSPRPCFGWRRCILRCFGAKIGIHVNVYPTTRVYLPWNLTIGDWSAVGEDVFIYNLGPIKIGERVTISHRAHLCAGTHDYRRPELRLLKPSIEIAAQAWVCADAFVGPGVRIGEGAVVGARAVAVKDVAPWMVVAGNPARVISHRQLTQN
jgi:putative colanic acid biosynthesis acetyltransferase WcaF